MIRLCNASRAVPRPCQEREFLARLQTGFWASEVVDHGFVHSLYSFDPNNIPIEFGWSVPDRDPRQAPLLRDRAPSAVAQEGAEAQSGHWPAVADPSAAAQRRVYPGIGSELFAGPDEPEIPPTS